MLTSQDRSKLIQQLRALPTFVEAAVKGLDERQLNTPYRENGWTVRQVVHHLVDAHVNGFIRMKFAIAEQHPTLKPYNQDDWAKLPDANDTPVEDSLAILKGLHARWATLLERLPESAWRRTAYHPEHGDVTMDDLLTTYAKHGQNHVGQITGLRARKGW